MSNETPSDDRPNINAIMQDQGGCSVCSGKTTREEIKDHNKEQYAEGYVKVHVSLEEGGETLWAKRTDKENEFEICNTPFFASEIGCGDIVRGSKKGPHFYELKEVVKHVRETYYLEYLIEFDDKELKKRLPVLMNELRAKEYTTEGVVAGYLVVGVPYGEGPVGVLEVIKNTKSGLKVKIYEDEDDE